MKKFTLLILVMLLSVVGTNATEIWTGSCTIGNWSGSSVTVDKDAFSSAAEGNIIKVTISNYAEKDDQNADVTYWQYSLGQKGNSWTELTDFSGGDLTKGQTSASYTLTATNVTELKDYGLSVNGRYITVTKVELLAIDGTVSLFSGSTETGNWNNNVTWSSDDDKKKLAAVQLNDYIKMTYTVTASGAQAAIQAAWSSVAAKDDNSYVEEGDNSGKTLTLTIDDATTLEKIQQNNIQVRGKNITITAVEHIKANNRYDAVPLTIGPDGICSFGSSKNLDFSGISGVTPYYVSEYATGSVTLTAVSTTRAWAGYIVQGTAGTYSVPVAGSEPDWIDAFNNLHYAGDYDNNWVYRSAYSDYTEEKDAEKIKTYYRYIFAKDETEGIGFYKLATDYTEDKKPYHVIGAHKAYLETPSDITPISSARVAFRFDGDITGVEEVSDFKFQAEEDNAYYNLNGQRIAKPTKGIYIQNGKKYVIK